MRRDSFRYSLLALFLVCICAGTTAFARAQNYTAICAALDPALMYLQVERGIAKVLTEVDTGVKGAATLVTKKVTGSAVHRGNGEFLTNDHVVNPEVWKNRRVSIETDDGKKYPATVLWNDSVHDLAKISIAPYPTLPVIPFGNSKNLRVADYVFSVGYQFGNKVFTSGSVASLEIKLTQSLIELDITFNPGTSGGASFTCDGMIIGINLAKGPGLGFIIPIDRVRQIEQHMDKFKVASYGALGVTYVSMRDTTPDDLQKFGVASGYPESGMLITAVRPLSAALKAGLEPGDVITAIDDTITDQPYHFARKVFYTPPGEKLSLSVRKHDGREVRLTATIDKADDEVVKNVASQLKFFDRN